MTTAAGHASGGPFLLLRPKWRAFFVSSILSGEQMSTGVTAEVPSFRFRDEQLGEVVGRAAIPLAALAGLLTLVGAGAATRLRRVTGPA